MYWAAYLQEHSSGTVIGSLVQSFFADLLGKIKPSIPLATEMLTRLLDWLFWQVQMKAAYALGEIRRNIPDVAIRRLLELRKKDHNRMRQCTAMWSYIFVLCNQVILLMRSFLASAILFARGFFKEHIREVMGRLPTEACNTRKFLCCILIEAREY
ncbi:hypothetical protein [Reticulibacter mediterranei]|uniref:hypothetical protein n=1 Tax=Reticulibacter mediterranei TaxID=2778369 RepID=UPI001C68EE8D|nr:hypothetical protein [Reticulibacter mediterranei]